MEIAVIKTGGKQYLVEEGKVLRIEKIPGEKESEVIIDEVLLSYEDGGEKFKIGEPFVSSTIVKGKIMKQGRAKKVRVVKFKPKVRYKRLRGHRQPFTEIKITRIQEKTPA